MKKHFYLFYDFYLIAAIQLVLLVLKALHLVNWGWDWILMPLWILGIYLVIAALAIIFLKSNHNQ